MLRILLSAMLVLAAFSAAAPTASAACLDINPDDDGIGSDGCQVPVLGECNLHVLAYGELPGSGGSCDAVVDCVQDCDGPDSRSRAPPCGVSADPLALTVSAVCTVSFCEVGPVVNEGAYDHAVSCQSPIVCVTEPCPGSGRIEI